MVYRPGRTPVNSYAPFASVVARRFSRISPAKIRTCALRSGWPVSPANTWPRIVAVPSGGAVCCCCWGGRICCGPRSRAAASASVDSMEPREKSEYRRRRHRQIDGLGLAVRNREPGGMLAREREEVGVGPGIRLDVGHRDREVVARQQPRVELVVEP